MEIVFFQRHQPPRALYSMGKHNSRRVDKGRTCYSSGGGANCQPITGSQNGHWGTGTGQWCRIEDRHMTHRLDPFLRHVNGNVAPTYGFRRPAGSLHSLCLRGVAINLKQGTGAVIGTWYGYVSNTDEVCGITCNEFNCDDDSYRVGQTGASQKNKKWRQSVASQNKLTRVHS